MLALRPCRPASGLRHSGCCFSRPCSGLWLRPGPGRLRFHPNGRGGAKCQQRGHRSTAPRGARRQQTGTAVSNPDAARAVPDTDTGGRCGPRGAPGSAGRCGERHQPGQTGSAPRGRLRGQLGPRGGWRSPDTRPAPSHRQARHRLPPQRPLGSTQPSCGQRKAGPSDAGTPGAPRGVRVSSCARVPSALAAAVDGLKPQTVGGGHHPGRGGGLRAHPEQEEKDPEPR